MKNVILSADNELKVYLVPDFVAESFEQLCTKFHRRPPKELLKEIRGVTVYSFDETDFVKYLNEKICADEKCVFVETLGWDYNRKKWPEKYRKCPHYNF